MSMSDENGRAGAQDTGDGGLGGYGGSGGGVLKTLMGEPEDRKTRLIGAAGVAIALAVLVLLTWANQRSRERKNLEILAASMADAQAVVQLNVQLQEVVDGAMVTRMSLVEVDATGTAGEPRLLDVMGATVHVGVGHASVKHRRIDAPLEFYYFDTLSAPEVEPLTLLEEPPAYYEYRGDREGTVRKTTGRIWDWLSGDRPVPGYLELTTAQLAGFDLPLLLGEQWELQLTPTGMVDSRRLRSPRDGYERFDVSSPIATSSGLEVVVEETIRQVEFAERIDPDLVYHRLRVRLFNKGTTSLTIDPNRFQLQDDRQQVFRPVRSSSVTLGAGQGQTLRIRFLAPPTSRGLRFTIPGETVAGGDDSQPVVVFLRSDDAYTGDAVPVGDYLVSLDHVERNLTDAGFDVVALLTVANLTWDARTLETKQFQIDDLGFDSRKPVEASSVSIVELEPFLPEKVAVTFPVGESMERVDLDLQISALRKKVVHKGATFDLTPLDLTDNEAGAGRTYIHQLCGARHFQKYDELITGGARGVLGLLTDRKAREREARHHLDLARSYFSGSDVIGAVATAPSAQ
jgi:hypothetical protein